MSTMTRDEALAAIGELNDYVFQLDKKVWSAQDIKEGVQYQHPQTSRKSTIVKVSQFGGSKYARLSYQYKMWGEANNVTAEEMAKYLNNKKCVKVAA